ncbi:RNA-binding protein 2 isoform X1 [Jatropha curcas]|uniref:RNA-binding protein 2 isoform X1 n=1 Tax=Jatropha curcas TaxID=180498 RepID=UPI0009D7153D|nr:RNA-binding protein 2 isoform X1 [Jatropha curcas]
MRESLPNFSGYHIPVSNELRDSASGFLQREQIKPLQSGSYGLDNISSIGVRTEPVISEVIAGASGNGYPSVEDTKLPRQRRDASVNIISSVPDLINGRPSPSRNVDGPSISRGESNILFVDGLPTDCTRREVGHLFRPFIGYKDIKVIHKEPRRTGDKAMVLCFVEFVDTKCAITAKEALQGYRFDDRKPDSPVLKIHFAHFPFRLPSDHDEQRVGILR